MNKEPQVVLTFEKNEYDKIKFNIQMIDWWELIFKAFEDNNYVIFKANYLDDIKHRLCESTDKERSVIKDIIVKSTTCIEIVNQLTEYITTINYLSKLKIERHVPINIFVIIKFFNTFKMHCPSRRTESVICPMCISSTIYNECKLENCAPFYWSQFICD